MINYTHQINSRSKSIKIHISPDGKILVTSPKFIPKIIINNFVKKNEAWVVKQLAILKNKHLFDQNLNEIMIFGKKYQKVINFNFKNQIGVKLEAGKLIINPIENSPEKNSSEITRFLQSTAKRYILPRTNQLGHKMNLQFNHITLKQQKTRWGSCSSKKNLNFNWRLVHYSPKIIDYVIIHELAHLKHMNHSKSFWELVRTQDPEYLKHRGWLKRHGLTLG